MVQSKTTRLLAGIAFVATHGGIMALQSAWIGFGFLTAHWALYRAAFFPPQNGGATAENEDETMTGRVVGVIAVAAAAFVQLPETWPRTPMSLFSRAGPENDLLYERFTAGRKRLVLAPQSARSHAIVGEAVLGCLDTIKCRHRIELRDAWGICLNDTIHHRNLVDLTSVTSFDADRLVDEMEAILNRILVLDVSSGRCLSRVFYVELGPSSTLSSELPVVAKVLSSSSRE